jgi:hypothetical protein
LRQLFSSCCSSFATTLTSCKVTAAGTHALHRLCSCWIRTIGPQTCCDASNTTLLCCAPIPVQVCAAAASPVPFQCTCRAATAGTAATVRGSSTTSANIHGLQLGAAVQKRPYAHLLLYQSAIASRFRITTK